MCRPGPSCCRGGWAHLSADHDLGRLDDGQCLVAPPELQFGHGIARDDRGQRLVANPQPDLREQAFAPDFLDDATKLVPAAQRDDRAAVRGGGVRQGPAGQGEKALDLRVRDAVVPTGRGPRPDDPLVDPLLDGRVADAEPARGLPRGHKLHVV